jgi:hypothetical protein
VTATDAQRSTRNSYFEDHNVPTSAVVPHSVTIKTLTQKYQTNLVAAALSVTFQQPRRLVITLLPIDDDGLYPLFFIVTVTMTFAARLIVAHK